MTLTPFRQVEYATRYALAHWMSVMYNWKHR